MSTTFIGLLLTASNDDELETVARRLLNPIVGIAENLMEARELGYEVPAEVRLNCAGVIEDLTVEEFLHRFGHLAP